MLEQLEKVVVVSEVEVFYPLGTVAVDLWVRPDLPLHSSC